MSVPSREDAARLLADLGAPAWLVRHSASVAEIATFLTERIRARGTLVNAGLVEAAALLHDIDKVLPAEHELHALGHAAAGAEWLRRQGHPELAPAVAGHTATLLSDDERYRRWVTGASLEERIVAYADKRAEQDIVTIDERFAAWRARHPEHADSLALGLERALLLEEEVCRTAGIEPGDVSRTPWFDDLRGARLGTA
jgi:putative nucleotidyltransferase with HDIG domain